MARWRTDGKEIFYRAGAGRALVATAVSTHSNTVQIGAGHQIVGYVSILGYDASSDGQRFLLSSPTRLLASQPMTVVENWTAALKK